jgi:hypothetical protein
MPEPARRAPDRPNWPWPGPLFRPSARRVPPRLACMNLLRRLLERLFGWGAPRAVQAEPDAADFGTSFGLEMSLLPPVEAPRHRRRRAR